MTRRNLQLLFAGVLFCLMCYSRDDRDPYARYVADAYAKIDQYAYDDVPDKVLYEGAMQGMIGVLHDRGDDHSGFVPEMVKATLDEELEQQFAGIGVRLGYAGDPLRLTIAAPLVPDGPASNAGVKPGDVVLAIDNTPVGPPSAYEMQRVRNQIRGRPDYPLVLKLERAGATEPLVVNVVREMLVADSVIGDRLHSDGRWEYRLESDPRVALVRVISFGDRTADELTHVLGDLLQPEDSRQPKVEAVILDLRDNPGGTLRAGVAVCEMFLDAGLPVFETRDRQEREQLFSSFQGAFNGVPLAVLTNGESASASELVAGCLKDNNRAVVVGQRSFGKGTIQQLVPVQSGRSYLKLTSATFWPPSGRRIHRPLGNDPGGDWGITPSPGLDVPMSEEQVNVWRQGRNVRDAQIIEQQVAEQPSDSAAASERPADAAADIVVEKAAQHLIEQLHGKPSAPPAHAEFR